MAYTSSTQLLAPHIKARTLKKYTKGDGGQSDNATDVERKVPVDSLRNYLTLGGARNERDEEVLTVPRLR